MSGRILASRMDAQKKRLLIIVLFGVALVGAVFLFTDPAISPPAAELPPAPTVALPAPNTAINNKTPVLPQGSQVAGQAVRDIFAPPAEYARLVPQEPRAANTNGSRNLPVGPTPVLTGIIVGESSRVAILRQGAISRSHRVGEMAGEYRVAAISANTVTLAGPGGTVVLKMGQ